MPDLVIEHTCVIWFLVIFKQNYSLWTQLDNRQMFLVVTLHQLIIMVTSCIAIGCTNRVKAGSGISFHRFPLSRPELLHKWVQAVRRENWTPKKHSTAQ